MSKFTGIFTQNPDGWWTAQCVEVPSAITQGRTLPEARKELRDAIAFMLKVQRARMMKDVKKSGLHARVESLRA